MCTSCSPAEVTIIDYVNTGYGSENNRELRFKRVDSVSRGMSLMIYRVLLVKKTSDHGTSLLSLMLPRKQSVQDSQKFEDVSRIYLKLITCLNVHNFYDHISSSYSIFFLSDQASSSLVFPNLGNTRNLGLSWTQSAAPCPARLFRAIEKLLSVRISPAWIVTLVEISYCGDWTLLFYLLYYSSYSGDCVCIQ